MRRRATRTARKNAARATTQRQEKRNSPDPVVRAETDPLGDLPVLFALLRERALQAKVLVRRLKRKERVRAPCCEETQKRHQQKLSEIPARGGTGAAHAGRTMLPRTPRRQAERRRTPPPIDQRVTISQTISLFPFLLSFPFAPFLTPRAGEISLSAKTC